jgi:hypothetical protein
MIRKLRMGMVGGGRDAFIGGVHRMAARLDGEALALRELVKKSGKIFALTHNYTGYPMVKQARELVQRGALGKILKVVAEYPQGWLLRPIDAEGQKQAAWRTNPDQAGASACVADIGTHAENLARYITALRIDELCADFTTFVRDAVWKTTPICFCGTKEELAEFFAPPKSWLVRRMTSTCECMEPKHLLNGTRKTRTTNRQISGYSQAGLAARQRLLR